MAHLATLLQQSKTEGTWMVLGHATWRAYVADVASTEMPLMHSIARVSLVKFLTDEGLTQREIAESVGISKSQVDRDQKAAPEGESKAETKGPQARTSTLTDRVTKALESVRGKVGDKDKIPTADLKRLQKELQHTLADVIEQLQVREAVTRHPAGSQGTNPRTGSANSDQQAA
jgi:transposase